jgi:uncharacterized Fe-S cluster protein YjdI
MPDVRARHSIAADAAKARVIADRSERIGALHMPGDIRDAGSLAQGCTPLRRGFRLGAPRTLLDDIGFLRLTVDVGDFHTRRGGCLHNDDSVRSGRAVVVAVSRAPWISSRLALLTSRGDRMPRCLAGPGASRA